MSEGNVKVTVQPGRSVVTDRTYLPGEELELSTQEANRLKGRGIVTIVKAASQQQNRPNVGDTVKLVEAAESIEALDELAKGEERKGVKEAIDKRRAELTEAK